MSHFNNVLSEHKESTNKKINLKRNFYHKNFSQLKNYYISLNLSNNNPNKYITNNPLEEKKVELKKNLTFYNQEARPNLTNIDRKKIKLIIKNFDKNKVVTEELFDQDKRLRLNSVNKSNYFFLINNGKQYKYNRNKGRNVIKRINDSDYSTSSMIDKFNNKTAGILDISAPKNIFSKKNFIKFTKQIINNFSDKIKLGKDLEYSTMKNKNAMKILEFFDELQIKKAIETEKNFYNAKYNQFEKNYESNEKQKNDKIENWVNQNPFNDKLNNNHHERRRAKTKSLIKRKINFGMSPHKKNLKNKRNSVILTESDDKLLEKYDKYKQTDNFNHNINSNEKLDNFNDVNYSFILKSNKNISQRNEIICNSELLMKEFHKISDIKKLKKIQERSKTYADSIAEMNYMPYQPMNHPNRKIYYNNLKRAIKINFIKKHLINTNKDELMPYDIGVIKDELLETQSNIYKANFKKKSNFHFLKNKFKSETIRKFGYIKDSYFGIPC